MSPRRPQEAQNASGGPRTLKMSPRSPQEAQNELQQAQEAQNEPREAPGMSPRTPKMS